MRAKVSRTSRPPRVQEMFFEKIPLEDASVADGIGANPFLRRERSRNLQFGANLSTDSLLVDGDLAQLRVTRFDNRIRDYIKPQYLLIVHPPEVEPFVVPIDCDPQLNAWTDVLDADDFDVGEHHVPPAPTTRLTVHSTCEASSVRGFLAAHGSPMSS